MEKKFIILDRPNINNRLYSTATITQAIAGLDIVPGCLDMPPDRAEPNNSEISHVVENLQIKDGFLIGTVKPNDSEKGKLLQSMIDAGLDSSFRTAGMGTLHERDDGVVEVRDFILMSINFVDSEQHNNEF